ncbi:hypothetical protein DFQ01_1307 [Paenibacillus cellulosilyticus]|uniref:Uncharacterized protein n=1 Tax=Paenibacillus cellulosilyticus TaxID=375489 RepID=A0A2V2YVH2_9BACL|nr:hypothetical protein DFQ01_1307 [Paenibacillus cellulosilyticus]
MKRYRSIQIIVLTILLLLVYSIAFYLVIDKITFEWALKTRTVSAAHLLRLNIYSRYIGVGLGVILSASLLLIYKKKARVYYSLFIIHVLVAGYVLYLIYVDQNYIYIPYIKDDYDF